MHIPHRLGTAAAVAAVVASGTLAAYAIMARVDVSQGEPPTVSGGADVLVPTPTPAAPAPVHTGREQLNAELRASWPALLAAIESVETGDMARIRDVLSFREFPCTAEGRGVAPTCADLGVPAGTPVRLFHYYLRRDSYFTEQQALEKLRALLAGTSPRLALMSRLPNGQTLVVFTINDIGGTGIRGVEFYADPAGGPRPFVSYTERYVAASPLDELRESGVLSADPGALLYVSPALEAWEREKHDLHRNPSPGPGVTPATSGP